MVSGVVLGPSGEPLEGATCSLSRGRAPLGLDSVLADLEDDASVVAAAARTLSDSTGRFELPAPPGAPGFGEARKELDLGGRPQDGEVEVHLSL